MQHGPSSGMGQKPGSHRRDGHCMGASRPFAVGGGPYAESPPLHSPEGRLGRTWLRPEGGEEPGGACQLALTETGVP